MLLLLLSRLTLLLEFCSLLSAALLMLRRLLFRDGYFFMLILLLLLLLLLLFLNLLSLDRQELASSVLKERFKALRGVILLSSSKLRLISSTSSLKLSRTLPLLFELDMLFS